VASVIDPSTRVGAVRLTIADLTRSVHFYQSHLGLTLHQQDGGTAWLGAGGPHLLTLTQSPDAPRVQGTTGLYHFAILVPSRADLARALRRLVETRTLMQGAADHGVSESLYLADPDGNGIEIYRDRPREQWPFPGGRLLMVTDPIDLDALLEEADAANAPLPSGTAMGHVHLRVAELRETEHFYVTVLGFELMQRFGPGALFVSAGGYHHHIGLNIWESAGAAAPPPGAVGLRHFEVLLPNDAALGDVVARVEAAGIAVKRVADGVLLRDPAGNALELKIRN
jgi:catechol 2,3-dioxygenase